jgi:hypothetical protein
VPSWAVIVGGNDDWMIRMKKITKTIVGVILIILGLVALLTPLSPGSWLILVGLELLGLRILLEGKLLAWAKARPGSKLAHTLCKVLRVKERAPRAAGTRRRRLGRRREMSCPEDKKVVQ